MPTCFLSAQMQLQVNVVCSISILQLVKDIRNGNAVSATGTRWATFLKHSKEKYKNKSSSSSTQDPTCKNFNVSSHHILLMSEIKMGFARTWCRPLKLNYIRYSGFYTIADLELKVQAIERSNTGRVQIILIITSFEITPVQNFKLAERDWTEESRADKHIQLRRVELSGCSAHWSTWKVMAHIKLVSY